MIRLRHFWLACAIFGAIWPMMAFIPYLAANGWDLGEMIDRWMENDAVLGVTRDLMVSAGVLNLWILAEVAVRRNWAALLAIPATWCIGVSCGLPLYLYFRSKPI